MKFKTADIISRIDALTKQFEAEAEIKRQQLDEEVTLSADIWYDEYSDGYRQLVSNIFDELGKGKVITTAVIPASIKGRDNTSLKFYFAPTKGRPLAEERKYENLQKLRNALQASQEDTVSPTAIKQLGFQDVTFLFTAEAAK